MFRCLFVCVYAIRVSNKILKFKLLIMALSGGFGTNRDNALLHRFEATRFLKLTFATFSRSTYAESTYIRLLI